MFGFVIGVVVILAVLTLGEAGKREVQHEMSRLGIDKIWLTAENEVMLQKGSGQWLNGITGSETEEVVYIPLRIKTEKGKNMQVTAVGCAHSYLKHVSLKEGIIPYASVWNRSTGILLLGEEAAETLEVSFGDYVNVASMLFEVRGIMRAAEGVTSVNFETAAVLPIDFLCERTNNSIHEIQLTASEHISLSSAQKQAVRLLETQGYRVNAVTMQTQMEAAENVVFTFVNVLKWIAGVCILVGGVGVMNILLVGVRERTREIGVMKSIGTTGVQICILFLLEALVYAVIGSILGIGLGACLCFAAGKSIQIPAVISFADGTAVFISALLTGLCFGVFPACKASRLKCVDALRQE